MCVPDLCNYQCVIYRYQCCEIASTITQSSWVLSLSYCRANTFLSCRISKLKMNKFGATVVKNQQFWLLWHPFPCLKLKLGYFESYWIVTRELIPLFYVESANQNPLQSVWLLLLRSLQYSILQLKKAVTGCCFFYFRTPLCASVFLKMKRIIREYTFTA